MATLNAMNISSISKCLIKKILYIEKLQLNEMKLRIKGSCNNFLS